MPTFLPLSSSLCYWRSLILTCSLIHSFKPSAHTQASRRTHQDTYTRAGCPPVVCGVARHAEASMDCTSTAMIRFFSPGCTRLSPAHTPSPSHTPITSLPPGPSPQPYFVSWEVEQQSSTQFTCVRTTTSIPLTALLFIVHTSKRAAAGVHVACQLYICKKPLSLNSHLSLSEATDCSFTPLPNFNKATHVPSFVVTITSTSFITRYHWVVSSFDFIISLPPTTTTKHNPRNF
ncbi:hypothetical protein V8C40DRAFT_245469 [Trichoderma camerunense]